MLSSPTLSLPISEWGKRESSTLCYAWKYLNCNVEWGKARRHAIVSDVSKVEKNAFTAVLSTLQRSRKRASFSGTLEKLLHPLLWSLRRGRKLPFPHTDSEVIARGSEISPSSPAFEEKDKEAFPA